MDDVWKYPIIVITVPGRVKKLKEKIREENVLNLNFIVCDMEEFKKGNWGIVESAQREVKNIKEEVKKVNILHNYVNQDNSVRIQYK